MKESKEDVAKFAAEMAQLSKDPRMKPFLTSTEAKRQEKEEKRKREADEAESIRRDHIVADWIGSQMEKMAPEVWAEFQATKSPEVLARAGWQLDVMMEGEERPGFEPVPITLASIMRLNKFEWETPKPIKGKIIMPGDK